MNQLQNIFNFQGQQLRTVIQTNEPWFVAKDVCDILEIKNVSQAMDRLDDDERSMFNIGRQGNVNIVNESGLYELIFASRKKEAKDFKRWLKREVLPSIRKTGSYETRPMSIEDMIITQAKSVKELKQEVAQIKDVVDNEVWVNERQKKSIQDSVSCRVFELRRQGHDAHFQTLYSSLKRFFGVSKYDKIPRKDYDVAMNFIKGWYPSINKEYKEYKETR